MVLGFNKRFPDKIMNETKIHTIREDKTNRWQQGVKIHFATGVRTKNYNCFDEGVCASTQSIEIIRMSDYLNETVVKIDGRVLDQTEVQQLAWNDGFENLAEFWLWFSDSFKGKIIHWTDYKY